METIPLDADSSQSLPSRNLSSPAQQRPATRQTSGGVCSCSAVAPASGVRACGVCPLGMPWACFRQLVLPFDGSEL